MFVHAELGTIVAIKSVFGGYPGNSVFGLIDLIDIAV